MDSAGNSFEDNDSSLHDSSIASSIGFSPTNGKPKPYQQTGTFRMQDLDLGDSLKASMVRQNPGASFQESGSNEDEPIRQVREEFRQRLLASDPEEEFEIDMEASDLQLNSDYELRHLRNPYGLMQSQIPA